MTCSLPDPKQTIVQEGGQEGKGGGEGRPGASST